VDMRWVIGLDLRPQGGGALQFARWMAGRASTAELHAVHVLEESKLLAVLRREHLEEVEPTARKLARTRLDDAGLTDLPERVVRAKAIDEALGKEAMKISADGLLIGRQGRADQTAIVRLGRVSRRLLRTLPVPIVVAPPELDAERVGEGPVLLATDLQPASSAAARFAKRMADMLGRKVLVAHIVHSGTDTSDLIPAVTVEQFYRQMGLDRKHDLHGWMREHALEDAPAVVGEGDVVARLLGIAAEERVPAIVCGSRHLGVAERLFTSSVATELSRHASCAVAVVGG
jgi:nucleotide-binding universal stress UspA family protein